MVKAMRYVNEQTGPATNALMAATGFIAVQWTMPVNILLIQDDAQCAQVVLNALAKSRIGNFHVEWVKTCALGLKRLADLSNELEIGSGGISAILVDLLLPDMNGMEVIDLIYAATKQIPIVILSSMDDEAIAKSAMWHGAQDFLLKERLDDYVLPKTLVAVIERAAIAEVMFNELERAQVTLNSIGDAVISTDISGKVTYLNIVAERLTGWPSAEAIGRSLEEVFIIVDANTREILENPLRMATLQNKTVGLPPTCILIRRDGIESSIEDSSAPIHDRRGRVRGAVMVFHDVSTARALTLKLEHYAEHDSLTDLPNRTLLNDRMTQAISMAQRHHTALAVLYLDLDRFKHINDSLGHMMGDRLLRSVALRLSECIRATDTVCRLGGDEFVILLSEVTHVQDAAACADKLLQAVRMPYVMDEHELHVTASVGIGIYPGDGSEGEALLKNADSAMYEAKDRGRNNYQFYRSDLNSSATERQSLEGSLRHAVERHELELHYQPIMNLASGAIVGVEALIRWQHPTLGFVRPSQFIAAAEECGLLLPIGKWVLREACRQAKAWQDGGLSVFRLAVNISAVELRSKEFVAGVAAILAETGFDPRCLELELNETFLMQDSKSTALVLNALKSLGIRLALDDFGTGYSSLTYMRRFPIDALKVDQSLVRDLTTDAHDASVVSAIINMARSLHMRVVAEGVETREQRSFLEKHKCTEAQGFHFSRALKAEAFGDLLRAAPSRIARRRSSGKSSLKGTSRPSAGNMGRR
jgi:diguanylate cyclase (GGDEF)-like protein/PAS domain S-box-containing protein